MAAAGAREVTDASRSANVRLRAVAETHDTTAGKLEWLEELRGQALHAGSEKAVAKRREEGRLLARERAEKLCDPGSFVELDRYVRHREVEFGMRDKRPYGDAVVTGYGTVFGRKVFLFSQDFTVFGGSLSEVFAEKICKVMDMAVKYGCPVIGINDSGGARIQEGVVSLAGLRGDLLAQRPGVGRRAADLARHGAVRRRRRLLARDDRLHLHGRGLVVHVHHRPRRREDGDGGGGHVRGARRRDDARGEVGRRAVHCARRGVVPRGRALPPELPAAEQRRAAGVERADRSGRPDGRRARHAHPRQPEQAVRHARGHPARRRRRRVPRGERPLGGEHRLRVRAARRVSRSASSATSRARSPASSTSTRRTRRRGSSARATRSTSRS